MIIASTQGPTEQEADLAPWVEGCRGSGTRVLFCLEPNPAHPHVAYDRTMVHIHGGTPTGLSTENYRSMALGACLRRRRRAHRSECLRARRRWR